MRRSGTEARSCDRTCPTPRVTSSSASSTSCCPRGESRGLGPVLVRDLEIATSSTPEVFAPGPTACGTARRVRALAPSTTQSLRAAASPPPECMEGPAVPPRHRAARRPGHPADQCGVPRVICILPCNPRVLVLGFVHCCGSPLSDLFRQARIAGRRLCRRMA